MNLLKAVGETLQQMKVRFVVCHCKSFEASIFREENSLFVFKKIQSDFSAEHNPQIINEKWGAGRIKKGGKK